MADAQDDWGGKRVEIARKACAVAEQAVSAITDQLRGPMSERALRQRELNDLAKSLLDALNDTQQVVEGEK